MGKNRISSLQAFFEDKPQYKPNSLSRSVLDVKMEPISYQNSDLHVDQHNRRYGSFVGSGLGINEGASSHRGWLFNRKVMSTHTSPNRMGHRNRFDQPHEQYRSCAARFDIKEKIGEGSYGLVYKAYDRALG